jgi:hypothetical protein
VNVPLSTVRADLRAMAEGDFAADRLMRLRLAQRMLQSLDPQAVPGEHERQHRLRDQILSALSAMRKTQKRSRAH